MDSISTTGSLDFSSPCFQFSNRHVTIGWWLHIYICLSEFLLLFCGCMKQNPTWKPPCQQPRLQKVKHRRANRVSLSVKVILQLTELCVNWCSDSAVNDREEVAGLTSTSHWDSFPDQQQSSQQSLVNFLFSSS